MNFKELSERKEKELNVVIYGMEERLETGLNTHTEEQESAAMSELISEKLGVQNPEISRAFCLGHRQHGRPRPFKVMLPDLEERRATLDSAKSLGRRLHGGNLRSTFIRPDWTQLQRKQNYQHRQAAKQAWEENRSTDSVGASNGQ